MRQAVADALDIPLTLPDPDVWRDAACVPGRSGLATLQDADAVFYPPGRHADYTDAALICSVCPISDRCLDAALLVESEVCYSHGYRGGMTPQERRELLDLVVAEAG